MEQKLKINFIGNFGIGYVGESSDEIHLARELESLGHAVNKIPRDIWKAYVDGEWNNDWRKYLDNLNSSINLIAKWHHFDKPIYISELKKRSHADVFYWTWDWMEWPQPPTWHKLMAIEADLHLTNEGDIFNILQEAGVKAYYFPFDVADGSLSRFERGNYKHDVVFFGSCLGQGDRRKWLLEIAKECNLTIYSWNYKDWQNLGFIANPALYGMEFNNAVARSKICLQFSVYDHCWGYWSNRVGKVLSIGGFLLARYTPGMELFLRDGAEYFSSVDEAVKKINYYLEHEEEREKIAARGYEIGRDRFTSKARIKDLEILIERYLKGAI